MSSSFDDLARALAAPIATTAGVRLLGSALSWPRYRASGPVPHSRAAQDCMPATRDAVLERQGQRDLPGSRGSVLHLPGGRRPVQAGTRCGGTINNACVDECPNRCKDGKCCPKSKGRCVKGTCCPLKRTTFAPGTGGKGVACCPPGTIAVPGGTGKCCPKGDLDCCDPGSGPDDDLRLRSHPKLKRGQLCVKGKVRRV